MNEATYLSSEQPRIISCYVTLCTNACLHAQCNCYFVKMTSSQRTMQSLFHVKTIL